MSVLLDALKKSEEEKKKAEGQQGEAETSSQPEPEAQGESGGSQGEAKEAPQEASQAAPAPSSDKPKPGAPSVGAPAAGAKPAAGGGGIGKLGMFSHSAPMAKPPQAAKRPAPPAGLGAKPPPGIAAAPGQTAPAAKVPPSAPPPAAATPPPVQAEAAGGMKISAPAPAKAAFDFDSLEEPAKETQTDQGKAVAGSVVSAGESAVDVAGDEDKAPASGAGGKPMLLAIAAGVAVVVAGGAYYLFSSPGAVAPAPATQPTSVASTSPTEEPEATDPADLLPLPSPNIDIQSELVNFASYTNENDASAEELQEVADRIAVLTSSFLESSTAQDSAETTEDGQGIVLELSALEDGEAAAVVSAEVVLDPATFPVRDASDSSARIAGESAEVDLGEGVRLYAVVDDGAAEEKASSGSAPVEADSVAITIAPSEKGGMIERLLDEAKREYNAGTLAAAEVTFRKILSDDANNLNAMKGLAIVASETGRYRLAASIYLKVLDLRPDDAVAIAELISLHATHPSYRLTEERLKSLLGRVPSHDGRLYFSLGNLYAEQGRWYEAQQNYFSAFSGEPDNPDYAFNLAVSLEYVNRQDIALNYYRIAQELAASNPYSFEESVLTTRILQLDN